MTRAKLESAIQRDVKRDLIERGWHVEVLSCNAYQKGIPDLYCFKLDTDEHGQPYQELHRWVDIKKPKGSTLTKSQCQKWPLWESIGLGVWILTGTGQEDVLFGKPNFRDFWKPRYDKYLLKDPADLLREEFGDSC